MNSNPEPTERTPDEQSSRDAAGRYVLSHKITDSTGVITTYVCSLQEEPMRFSFTHEQAKGLFVLTAREGNVARFRDKPTRFLVVEPDPETGELRPAVKHGEPVYLYLCREEREL
jgi:hypothetical protein